MRRLDILSAGILLLVGGGGLYGLLMLSGMEAEKAQSAFSVVLMVATVGWAVFYVGRVVTGKMAFHTQRDTYRRQMLKQKLGTLSPEELATLAGDLEIELDPESEPTIEDPP